MPYLDMKIPYKIFYPSTDSKILHIANPITDLINITCINLLMQMKKQGSECSCIISTLKNIFRKHAKVHQNLHLFER